MTTAAQAAAAATLARLDAPTPWWPLTASGRQIVDALGRPRLLVLPTAAANPGEDHALALAVCRLINEAAGEPDPPAEAPLNPDHLEAVSAEGARFRRTAAE
ncbi:hypothetical protein [Methylobacterium sp. JK268]